MRGWASVARGEGQRQRAKKGKEEIADYNELETYPYCGHGVIMGKVARDWLDVDFILSLFGSNSVAARSAYRQYVQGIVMGRRKDLIGGGLIRSQSGWAAVTALRGVKEHQKGDGRILGDGEFVEEVLACVLATLLARAGHRVVLVDLDLGAVNLHTYLGLRGPLPTIVDFIRNKVSSLDPFIVETSGQGLGLICGAGFVPGPPARPIG